MHTPVVVIALCTGMLALSACDKTPVSPPAPKVEAAQTGSAAAAGSVANTSVPTADSVFPAANAAKVDPNLGRSNSPLSAAQESAAMPMPGQNNDHSAPLGPAKRASAP